VPCTIEENAVFTIDNAFVVVEYFNTRPPGNIDEDQVTVDGFEVDDVIFKNGQYVAKTANVIPRIQKKECLNRDLPTKVFFLIEDAGPWDFRAKFILEGTVNTGGRNCRFCLVISLRDNASNISLPNNSLSDFAIPDLSLPCSINSIAPDIRFQFDANIEMINPRLVANCNHDMSGVAGIETDLCDEKHHHHHHNQTSPISSNTCTVALVTTLAIEPTVHVETIRQTLFCVNACEGLQPCQGSVTAALEEEEEECDLEDIFGPDCRCRKHDHDDDDDDDDDDVAGIRDRMRCEGVASNRTCGGVTMGVGTCDDCNNNNNGVLGERFRKDRVGGESICERLLGDRFDRDRDRDKDKDKDRVRDEDICDLLCEILDEVLGETSCNGDVAGVCGLSPDGTWGCGCNGVRGISNRRKDDVRGIRDRDKDRDREDVMGIRDRGRERTAFQFNGCN